MDLFVGYCMFCFASMMLFLFIKFKEFISVGFCFLFGWGIGSLYFGALCALLNNFFSFYK